VRNGHITQEQAAKMSEREILNLIFLPGFSTADKITNVSGRGVGMDVVKTNIEKIGGAIDILSRRGEGTTLKIKIPLTLAIIPALVVACDGDRYAIPQVNLLELVRLEGEEARKGIEKIHGVPVYRLRGNLLPLVYLHRVLSGNGNTLDDAAERSARKIVNIVVLQAGDHPFGLVVDVVNDTEEIVVKPLGKLLKGISAFAGATIMGDGRVALILDVLGLALDAHVLTEVHEKTLSKEEEEAKEPKENLQTLLLFRSPDDGRMALPLSQVARLEEFPLSTVERAGEQDVVQYRGEILPLIHLSQILPERRKQPRNPDVVLQDKRRDSVQAVVYTRRNKSVGLVVEQILDIIEDSLELQNPGTRKGVVGSAVIQNRVTELLDLEEVIRIAYPDFFADVSPEN
ncbi:MAG: chemotaxis protein CheW, partial [Elusimicrobia bacterium]|nr:chemotaxis protein CheW [Elusimicrobiota bacterium]